MIKFDIENLVTLTEGAKLLPRRRRGKKPHRSTLQRWAQLGFRGVRLEVIRVGSTLFTSREAIQRFLERTTELHAGVSASSVSPAPDDGEVEDELDALGI